MTTRKLKLYFKDETNSSKTITIDYPKDNFADDEIKTAMTNIIATNVIATKKGLIKTKEKAEIETIDKQSFEVKEA